MSRPPRASGRAALGNPAAVHLPQRDPLGGDHLLGERGGCHPDRAPGLSFLGLGLPPTIADWGIDVARGQTLHPDRLVDDHLPGLAIIVVVLAFSMMGEGLTEIFNPRLRER